MSVFISHRWSTVRQVLTATLLLLSAGLLISWNVEYESFAVRVEDAKARSDALEQHVKDMCKTMRFPDAGMQKTTGYMFYDDARKVIYCSIPKVRRTVESKECLLSGEHQLEETVDKDYGNTNYKRINNQQTFHKDF
ncbi:hypothetical protein E2C01_024586 [Portunus trituberculatus]|uniref:Uncharacterized protein n=1 Tax=Portunus trituberculatus TaxID=210409 RepID=A0A5B7EB14_PORTR|nr:hypothetical protein [Portunus trituberculatus]